MKSVNDAPLRVKSRSTFGKKRSKSVSKSSVLMRMMLGDAASVGGGDTKRWESSGPRSKRRVAVTRTEERRGTATPYPMAATNVLVDPIRLRALVYGV